VAITVISNLVPANNLSFPVVEDINLKGGLRVVDNIAERDAIDVNARKVGMYVATVSDNQLYQLDIDLVTWNPSGFGGNGGVSTLYSRATLTTQVAAPIVPALGQTGFAVWTVPTGRVCIIQQMAMSGVGEIKAYSTPARNDTNPYTFLSYPSHFIDDGTSLMSDGRLWARPRYITLANLEPTTQPNSYWSIQNTTGITFNYTITITIRILES